MSKALEDLRSYMISQNLPIQEEILIDGQLHRYSSIEGKGPAEWYICSLFDDGKIICTFSSWRDADREKHTWRSYVESEVDLKKEKDYMREQNEKILEEKSKLEIEAKKRLKVILANTTPCIEHPYLTKKKVSSEGLKVHLGRLIIPMYDLKGDLITIQTIDEGLNKRFYPCISCKGLFHPIGLYKEAKELIFCEGFATGMSIYESTGIPVICAMSAGNMLLVGKGFQQNFQGKSLIAGVDSDEAGEKVATEWISNISKFVVVPEAPKESKGYDFNDLMIDKGKDAVRIAFLPEKAPSFNLVEYTKRKFRKREWINDMILKGSSTVLFGPPGIGKSRLTFDIAFCLACKLPTLGSKTYTNSRVIYVDGEMSQTEIKGRLEDCLKMYPDAEIPDEGYLKIIDSHDVLEKYGETIDLYDSSWQRRLEENLKDSDVMILDNFGSLIKPISKDGYKEDIAKWESFSKWTKKLHNDGKTFIIVMHPNKSGALAGVQVIQDRVDTVMTLSKPTEIQKGALCHMNITFTKARALKNPEVGNIPKEAMVLMDEDNGYKWFFADIGTTKPWVKKENRPWFKKTQQSEEA